MVKSVDQAAFAILQVVGLTLPVFLLAVNAFVDDEKDYDKELVYGSILLLVGSALLSTVVLTFSFLENPILNASIALLWAGYVGLAWSIWDMMDLGELGETTKDIVMIGTILAFLAFSLTVVVRDVL